MISKNYNSERQLSQKQASLPGQQRDLLEYQQKQQIRMHTIQLKSLRSCCLRPKHPDNLHLTLYQSFYGTWFLLFLLLSGKEG